MKYMFSLLFIVGSVSLVKSQDLVYQPVNPAFGGDSFNYQWLKSSADAQNPYSDPDGQQGGFGARQSDIQNLSSSLNRQLLSQLTSQLTGNAFGENGLEPGSYTFAGLNVDIVPTNAGLSITVIDTNTGESTNIIVPFY